MRSAGSTFMATTFAALTGFAKPLRVSSPTGSASSMVSAEARARALDLGRQTNDRR
jgi:hypothetical protein